MNDVLATIAGLREQLSDMRKKTEAGAKLSAERLTALLDAERTITVLTDRCEELQAEIARLRSLTAKG